MIDTSIFFDSNRFDLTWTHGQRVLPKSKESQVSDVSVWVTLVIIVDADSVDVLMIASLIEAVEEPITTTFCVGWAFVVVVVLD